MTMRWLLILLGWVKGVVWVGAPAVDHADVENTEAQLQRPDDDAFPLRQRQIPEDE